MLADNGELDRALEHHEKALSVKELVLGPDHTVVALSHSHIGMAYDGKGDYSKALRSLQKALEIDERALGTEHPSIATRSGQHPTARPTAHPTTQPPTQSPTQPIIYARRQAHGLPA